MVLAGIVWLLRQKRYRPSSGHRPDAPIRDASGVRGGVPNGDDQCGGGDAPLRS